MWFLFYFQINALVNNNRKIFQLLFPIILLDTTQTPHFTSSATEEKKLTFTKNLQNYALFQSAGNRRKASELLDVTKEIITCLQSKLLWKPNLSVSLEQWESTCNYLSSATNNATININDVTVLRKALLCYLLSRSFNIVLSSLRTFSKIFNYH